MPYPLQIDSSVEVEPYEISDYINENREWALAQLGINECNILSNNIDWIRKIADGTLSISKNKQSTKNEISIDDLKDKIKKLYDSIL